MNQGLFQDNQAPHLHKAMPPDGTPIRDNPPPTECLDYVPSRHELLQLARYWARKRLNFSVDYFYGFAGSYESQLAATSVGRLIHIANILGDEAVRAVVKQVKDEYRWQLGRGIWEVFTRRAPKETEAVREGNHANQPDAIMPPRAVPQGLLHVDVGVTDCAPETWLEFGAFCKASGLSEKLAKQARPLWLEFMDRMTAHSDWQEDVDWMEAWNEYVGPSESAPHARI